MGAVGVGSSYGNDDRSKSGAAAGAPPQDPGTTGSRSRSSLSRGASASMWPDSLPLPVGDVLDTQSADDSFSLAGTGTEVEVEAEVEAFDEGDALDYANDIFGVDDEIKNVKVVSVKEK